MDSIWGCITRCLLSEKCLKYSKRMSVVCFISTCITLRKPHSRVAQWERAGPITQRSMDRNHSLLCFFFLSLFFSSSFFFPPSYFPPLFPFILFPIFPPPVFFLFTFPFYLTSFPSPFCLLIQQCCEYYRLGNRRKYRPLELGQKMLEGK